MSFHLLSMYLTNAYILCTTYGPNGTKLDHEQSILSIARTLLEEGLRTSRLNTPHVRTENLVQKDLRETTFQSKYQGKRE